MIVFALKGTFCQDLFLVYTYSIMKFTEYIVTKNDSGRRLDRILRRMLPDVPLSKIYQLLRKGLIRIDGKRIAPEVTVTENSVISIADVSDTQTKKHLPEASVCAVYTPTILLETPDLLFVNKPAGIVVHGDGGLNTLVPQSAGAKDSLSFRSGPLHRLDRDTTGIIAFSRTLVGAQWFSTGMRDHLFAKYYVGIVEGELQKKAEWIDYDEEDKKMITFAKPLALCLSNLRTLVLFKIITGRKHQIRKQSFKHGYPLWGDSLYGSDMKTGEFFLHAWQLHFPKNRLPELPICLVAPLPDLFLSVISSDYPKYVLAHIELGELYWRENEELQ